MHPEGKHVENIYILRLVRVSLSMDFTWLLWMSEPFFAGKDYWVRVRICIIHVTAEKATTVHHKSKVTYKLSFSDITEAARIGAPPVYVYVYTLKRVKHKKLPFRQEKIGEAKRGGYKWEKSYFSLPCASACDEITTGSGSPVR